MKPCLFCTANGPSSTVEHIIPESLGNDELILRGEVCDSCQSYFGKEIEQYVLNKTPLAFWRTYLRIKTKRGKEPSVNLSQPSRQKGIFPSVHSAHDNIGFTSHEDGSVSVEIYDDSIVQTILSGERERFQIVLTPKTLHMFGRFLCKVGLELLCSKDPPKSRSSNLDAARRFARYGDNPKLWPIFYYSSGNLPDLREYNAVNGETFQEVACYSYSLADYRYRYMLFGFSMGTENWIICLNDPYPDPVIQGAVPGGKLELIWYSDEELRKEV